MNKNKRVKELRKFLGLSGEKFGEKIGLKKAAISKIETGATGLSTQTIKSICREYNVNEDWLCYGQGKMFINVNDVSLDDLVACSSIDKLEANIVRAYFSLDKDLRQQLIKHFKDTLG